MGEMADYMLNGDDCQYCGQYLGEGDGFPRSCSGCGDEDEEEDVEIDFSTVKEAVEVGLSYIRAAALMLKEIDKTKKSKGLNNLADQISKFSESIK